MLRSSTIRNLLSLLALTLLTSSVVAEEVVSEPIAAKTPKTRATSEEPTPLVDAAEMQNWTEVARQIEAGCDINRPQVDDMTALHWAAFHEDAATVKKLIDAGTNPDASTVYQVTPLSIACTHGQYEIAKLLIDNGADINSRTTGKETPLMLASRTGNSEIVASLLENKAEVDATEIRGQTALMWAAAEGHAKIVDQLLAAGADPNRKIRAGFTPMMFAAREGHTDAALRLLKAGVDVNAVMEPKNSGGRFVRRGTSALMLAVENAHFELAMQLIANGADPNDQRSGFAPLHAVTWVRKTKVGDDPAGDPPPRGSGSLNSLQFVTAIVQAGALINLRLENGKGGVAKLNPKGATPFLLACRTADVQLMKLLLDLDADPSIDNSEGCTPLMAAAGVGVIAVGEEPGTEPEVIEAMRILVSAGVDVNAVDDNGETAMHGVAYRNYPLAVAALDRHGTDPDIWNKPNKHGWTPKMIASGKRPGSFKPSPETIAALVAAASSQLVPTQ